MFVALAIFHAVHVAIADTEDFPRPDQRKSHFRRSVRHAHAIDVHNPKFEVADVLVAMKYLGVGI
jgi:hypothetical protein